MYTSDQANTCWDPCFVNFWEILNNRTFHFIKHHFLILFLILFVSNRFKEPRRVNNWKHTPKSNKKVKFCSRSKCNLFIQTKRSIAQTNIRQIPIKLKITNSCCTKLAPFRKTSSYQTIKVPMRLLTLTLCQSTIQLSLARATLLSQHPNTFLKTTLSWFSPVQVRSSSESNSCKTSWIRRTLKRHKQTHQHTPMYPQQTINTKRLRLWQ